MKPVTLNELICLEEYISRGFILSTAHSFSACVFESGSGRTRCDYLRVYPSDAHNSVIPYSTNLFPMQLFLQCIKHYKLASLSLCLLYLEINLKGYSTFF